MAAALPCALVIYEAPHRVAATAAVLADVLGGERELVVARELTKKFETITRMPLADAAAWFAADANRERGEFVLLVDLPPPPEGRDGAAALAPDADRGCMRSSTSCRRPARRGWSPPCPASRAISSTPARWR